MPAETVFTRIGSSSEQTRLANRFGVAESRTLGLPARPSFRAFYQSERSSKFYLGKMPGQRGSP
jgi:hypothetical protein